MEWNEILSFFKIIVVVGDDSRFVADLGSPFSHNNDQDEICVALVVVVVGGVGDVMNKGGIVAGNLLQPEPCPVTAAIAAAFNILSKFD
ncbi:hypothetical protein BLA29_010312 [Euroglyphus maynei]|uniref:Uncharacterized protein n=1 Tax=Euroglyphus maynei TaxID=6958 RepID=A0A1Y3ASR9_EURMA|nr:hypothetical protein BLA29_010312 [Euroglyphus maynei]